MTDTYRVGERAILCNCEVYLQHNGKEVEILSGLKGAYSSVRGDYIGYEIDLVNPANGEGFVAMKTQLKKKPPKDKKLDWEEMGSKKDLIDDEIRQPETMHILL